MSVEILVLGVNHKTAPLELREKLSVPRHKAQDLLNTLRDKDVFRERVLLSTCNRTEIYGVADKPAESVQRAKEFLSEYSNLDLSIFEKNIYVLKQPDSVRHLFSVASGLNSMVVGETEILGQVKEAYLEAHKHRQTGKVLNNLFQRSLKVAKTVRTQTEIGSGRVSVASVAVELAEKIFETLKGAHVMVLGTGEMSSQVTKAMVSRGALPRIVSSKHFERAEAMAAEFGAEAVHYDRYEEKIRDTDIIIASTHAPKVLIQSRQIRSWMKVRHERPLFLIDIAMPRNIDPGAEKIDNVYLYNLDDLQGIANKNLALREGELAECFGVVHKQTQFFMGWLMKEFGPIPR